MASNYLNLKQLYQNIKHEQRTTHEQIVYITDFQPKPSKWIPPAKGSIGCVQPGNRCFILCQRPNKLKPTLLAVSKQMEVTAIRYDGDLDHDDRGENEEIRSQERTRRKLRKWLTMGKSK